MSKGNRCRCNNPKWEILHYKHTHSAFKTPKYAEHYSEYSTIICKNCNNVWRTKAQYVKKLQLYKECNNDQ